MIPKLHPDFRTKGQNHSEFTVNLSTLIVNKRDKALTLVV